MKLKLSDNTVYGIKEKFANAINNKDELLKLKDYFNESENIIKSILSYETLLKNETVDNYQFFSDFFNYFDITLDNVDLDLYLRSLFDDNYKLIELKTLIPNTRYDLDAEKIVTTVKKALFAIKDKYDVDLEHEYTSDEISLLHNQNKLRMLYLSDGYRNIDGFEYSELSKKYKKKNIMSLDFGSIKRYNFWELLNSCPYLFTFIRNNITFDMISDLLLEYETELTKVVNKELDNCNKQIENSQKRIDNIKKMTLKF